MGFDDGLPSERGRRNAHFFPLMEAIARDCGCRFLVVPVPPRGDLRGSKRALREALGSTSLEVLDVVPALRRALRADGRSPQALHFTHDAHLNAYGNRLYARAIADAVDWDAALASSSESQKDTLAE